MSARRHLWHEAATDVDPVNSGSCIRTHVCKKRPDASGASPTKNPAGQAGSGAMLQPALYRVVVPQAAAAAAAAAAEPPQHHRAAVAAVAAAAAVLV